ncbi:MAG: hypothetical protein IPJ40_17985 [Saprospirales bacterium]|nr:hypothetical protein [Saprospirales bacterium]
MRFLLTCLVILSISSWIIAQPGSKEFPEDPKEFLAQFEGFVTANKISAVQDIYGEFAALVKVGSITPEELPVIRQTANQMLSRSLSASPHFSEYLNGLVQLKKRENSGGLFAEWHQLLNGMLSSEFYKANSFLSFLKFSSDFFESRSIRTSSSGVSWVVSSDDFRWELREERPI